MVMGDVLLSLNRARGDEKVTTEAAAPLAFHVEMLSFQTAIDSSRHSDDP
jgi:hypothetical protein